MWIANDIWTEKKINANIEMHTAAPSIFGVAKYANELNKLVKTRNINLNTESNWCGIDHTKSKQLGNFTSFNSALVMVHKIYVYMVLLRVLVSVRNDLIAAFIEELSFPGFPSIK